MWKVMTVILNHPLTTSIAFHDILHFVQACRDTGTPSLKAKLLQQLTIMREEVLYVIFLDLHKLYDALDRNRCMDILAGYRVGPWYHRILRHCWDRLTMVDFIGCCYGE